MNCPFCLKLNLYQNVIKLPDIHVCENDNCSFYEIPERFEELYSKNNLSVTNIKEKDLVINDLTQPCTDNSDLVAFPRDNLDIELDEETEFNIIDNSKNLNDKVSEKSAENHMDILFQQFENTCTYLMNCPDENKEITVIPDFTDNQDLFGSPEEISYENKSQINEDISLDPPNYLNINKEKTSTIRHIFNTFNDSKSQIIDRTLTNNVSYGFWPINNSIFNWLHLPYYFRIHTKIVRILLLHLDFFQFNDTCLFDNLKVEYSINEAFANNCNVNVVKQLGYDFLQNLYETLDNLPDKDFHGKSLYEKVMCLLQSLFETHDLTHRLKVEYTTKLSCTHCQRNSTTTTNSYFVKLKPKEFLIETSANQLIYQTNCSKCKKQSTKTIQFLKVPQFVIFYCPSGLNGEFCEYENKIVADDQNSLSVISLIETDSVYHFREEKEIPIDRVTYDKKCAANRSNNRSGYCVHFRNRNGWYSINDQKDILCLPVECLSLKSVSNVRFVILGTVGDPRRYRNELSVRAFVKAHEPLIRNMIKSRPMKSEFDKLCQKMMIQQRHRKVLDITRLVDDLQTQFSSRDPPMSMATIVDQLKCGVDLYDDARSQSNTICDVVLSPKRGLASSSSDYHSRSSTSCDVTGYPHGRDNRKVSINSTSSGMSSNSSFFEDDLPPRRLTRRIGGYRKKFVRGDNRPIADNSSQKRIYSIDDLIRKHCKKNKMY